MNGEENRVMYTYNNPTHTLKTNYCTVYSVHYRTVQYRLIQKQIGGKVETSLKMFTDGKE